VDEMISKIEEEFSLDFEVEGGPKLCTKTFYGIRIRILKHLISYAEHQFGDRVVGRNYRERVDGDRIDNWRVEIEILHHMYQNMTLYNNDNSLGMTIADNLKFPYHEKMLNVLGFWSSDFILDSANCRSNTLNKDKINYILMKSSSTEWKLGLIYMRRNQYDIANSLCQQSLSNARLFDGKEEKKVELLCEALRILGDVRCNQGRYSDAIIFAEEAYNLVAIAYNPVHLEVQKAASTLIQALILNGDMYDARRFAEAALSSLKDPANGIDQESDEVAQGYYNFARSLIGGNSTLTAEGNREVVLAKAEVLARESLRIRTQLNDDGADTGVSVKLLAFILDSQYKQGDETTELYERILAIDTKHGGPDGMNTAISNVALGDYYHRLAKGDRTSYARNEHQDISIRKYKEALRIFTKVFGPDNPRSREVLSTLSIISNYPFSDVEVKDKDRNKNVARFFNFAVLKEEE
jgi:tetratricopeptide (TPR) repeat protein